MTRPRSLDLEKTVRAGLVVGKEQIELREFPDPEPEPRKAVVQIDYCGICGTDLHPFQQGGGYNPAICGHEWSGTVSALGAGVTNVREGDRVAIGVAPACGECPECRAGKTTHCTRTLMQMLGIGPLSPPHGGFAPAIAVEGARLYAVHPKLTKIDAAMLEPATVAVHALRRTPLRLGDSALVLGAGPIGLLILQCARIAGAGTVVVVEPEPRRAQLAAQLGASAVIDPGSEDVASRVREECGALGPDVVFECAGIPATIDQAATLVKRGGIVSLVGFATLPAEIAPGNWLAKEVTLIASLGYLHEEFDFAMQLIADGRLQMAPLHSGTVGLEGMTDAFRRLLSGDDGSVKILVDPNQ
jgi:(R,R)-butanediol dehydrogenase/meso-butanediol dehydrogenase/diacetyl reductase